MDSRTLFVVSFTSLNDILAFTVLLIQKEIAFVSLLLSWIQQILCWHPSMSKVLHQYWDSYKEEYTRVPALRELGVFGEGRRQEKGVCLANAYAV